MKDHYQEIVKPVHIEEKIINKWIIILLSLSNKINKKEILVKSLYQQKNLKNKNKNKKKLLYKMAISYNNKSKRNKN